MIFEIRGAAQGLMCPWDISSLLQCLRDTNTQQVPALGLEWGVVGTVVQNSTKALAKGVTIMQLQMVVAVWKYRPRDARSSYISTEATNENV